MPKLAANESPFVPISDPNLVGKGTYWQVEPPLETTHLLVGRLQSGGPHELNCNAGSIVVVVQGGLRLNVTRPLMAPADIELATGESYRMSNETRAQAFCHSEVILVVLRAGGPGGHPSTNRPPN